MSATFDSVFRPGLFDGKVALVTGGGTGIGRCIAHELATLGATVVLAGRRMEPLEQTAQEIRQAGGKVDVLQLNIREPEAVDAAIEQLVARHGGLQLVVNNAGGQFASPAAFISPKGWRAVVDTNLNGTWFVSQAAYKHALAAHGGVIVNIVADMWNGFPGMAHTGAARAGVVNLTQTLALEWASSGVRVNAVAPGYILSNGMNNYPEAVQELASEVMLQNPSARLGTESEVASATVFLLSPAAAYITGATLRIDGGGSLQKGSMVPMSEHENLPPFEGFRLPISVPERFLKRPSSKGSS